MAMPVLLLLTTVATSIIVLRSSKKRGLSLEEKREKMLQIFYDSQEFYYHYLLNQYAAISILFANILLGSVGRLATLQSFKAPKEPSDMIDPNPPPGPNHVGDTWVSLIQSTPSMT
ncbi:hypothetical protein Tco_1207671 [Tanacetum coccineum]